MLLSEIHNSLLAPKQARRFEQAHKQTLFQVIPESGMACDICHSVIRNVKNRRYSKEAEKQKEKLQKREMIGIYIAIDLDSPVIFFYKILSIILEIAVIAYQPLEVPMESKPAAFAPARSVDKIAAYPIAGAAYPVWLRYFFVAETDPATSPYLTSWYASFTLGCIQLRFPG